jgi:lipopolysaccharide export system permease protein
MNEPSILQRIKIPGLSIIDRYIIRKFLGTFFYSISLLILIVIIFDLSEKIDDFLTKQAPLQAIIFDYYFNFIPFFINLFSSLFTFISVIFFTSRLAARTEIIAILGGGISFKRLLRPYMIAASFLVILTIYLANFLIPITNRQLREFEKKYYKNPQQNRDLNIHMQIDPGVFVYIEAWDKEKKQGTRFSLERFDERKLVYKLVADKIAWDTTANQWKLNNFFSKRLLANGNQKLETGTTKDTVMTLQPSDFMVDIEDIKTMNFNQLNEFISREKLKGSKNIRQYEVEKHKRFAFPISAIILTLIGVALSSRKIRGGIGMHLGLGIAITFSYILFMQISTQFAVFGTMTPVLAVWLPNILFGLLAVYLIRVAPK